MIANVLAVDEITFAELEYLLCSAEYEGNIWSPDEIIEITGGNQYHRFAEKEYLIQEKRDNEEIYMNARKSPCASSLNPELVDIFMNPPNSGIDLPLVYMIKPEVKEKFKRFSI